MNETSAFNGAGRERKERKDKIQMPKLSKLPKLNNPWS